jgi:hypothetical protein
MPQYEFGPCDNPKCERHRRSQIHLIPYSMKDVPSVGTQIPCLLCVTGKITRLISSGISGIVKGGTHPCFTNGETFKTKDADGRPLDITFVDHPHTDPAYQTALARRAKELGVTGLTKAYHSEKHGCMCVDVASNVPDPLGRVSTHGERDTRVHKVSTPVRSPARRRSGPRLPSSCPIRRV